MAGHSKWAQIKRKKQVTDARRGQLWSRLLKEVSVAARLGGGDVDGNPRLRSAVQEAKAANVPNDNIDRAIQRGTGQLEGAEYEELTYEGYAPGGVAVLIEAITDNRNRTVSEVRHVFSKNGGNLGEAGCVSWMFDQRGYFTIEKDALSEEEFMEIALAAGADDISIDDEAFEIFTPPDEYPAVREELERREIPLSTRQLAMIPKSYVEVDAEMAPRVLRLLEALEDLEGVQSVWANLDVSSDVLAAQAG